MDLSKISRSAHHYLNHENGNNVKSGVSNFFSNLGNNLKSAFNHHTHVNRSVSGAVNHNNFLSDVSHHANNYLN